MNPQAVAEVQEAMRRRANLGGSGAGIQGGMPATQAPMSPMGQMGAAVPPQPNPMTQGMGVPAGSSPSDGAIKAMNGAQPGEAQIIVKALISRMNKIPPQQ